MKATQIDRIVTNLRQELTDLPGANELSKDTIFPSARALLDAGISCREPGGKGWAFYWVEFGCELTYFSGSEGPYKVSSVDEAIECIDGDQPCVLTPTSLKRFGVKA
jgi:hypothetical protein